MRGQTSTRFALRVAPLALLTVTCSSVAHGQEIPPALPSLQLESVLTDVAVDGTIWAIGPTWKMRIGGESASFYPYVGSRVSRSLPLTFAAPHLTVGGLEQRIDPGVPSLNGDSASVDHGAIVEAYRFDTHSVEQTFLIETLPNRGEVVLTIPVTTELVYRGRDHGLRFEHAGVCEVRYGDATIVDADGRHINVESTYSDEGIEVRVPPAFVAVARLPLLVDPVVTPTFPVETQSSSTSEPDVAYDAAANQFLVVYERFFSSTDRDVLANRISPTGTNLGTLSVDTSTQDTTDPACANNGIASQFLVVWRKEKSGLFDEIEIRGRTIVASNGAVGGAFEISGGSDNESNPVVAGTRASSLYLVAWQENPALSFGGENIVGRTVSTASGLGSKVGFGAQSDDEVAPSITKQTFDDQWLLVWERVDGSGDVDIRGARFNAVTGLVQNDFGIVTIATVKDDFPVAVALPNDDFVVIWSRRLFDTSSTGDRDLFATRLNDPFKSAFNLTTLENPSPFENLNQVAGGVALDGNRIVYVYSTEFSTSRVSSMVFSSGSPILIEAGLNLFGDKQTPRIASRAGSGGLVGRSLVVSRDVGAAPLSNITGQFFDSLTPGGVTVVQTGCGGPLFEPSLTADQAPPAICSSFSINLAGFDSPLLVIGLPTSIPLCPTQGGCVLGATPTVFIPTTNGLKTFVLPCDPTVLGVTTAITGVEFVSGGLTVGTCGPPVISQRIRTSDTLLIDFQ